MGNELFEKVQELYHNHEYEKALTLLESAPSAGQGNAIYELSLKVYYSIGYICQAKSILTDKIGITDNDPSSSRAIATFAKLFPSDSRSLPLAEKAWKMESSETSLVALIFSLLYSGRGTVEKVLEKMKTNEHLLSLYSKKLCNMVIAQRVSDLEQTLVCSRWLLENLIEPCDTGRILKALLLSSAKTEGLDSVVNRIQEFSEHKSLKHPAERALAYTWVAIAKMKQNDYVQALHFLRASEEVVSTSSVDLPIYVEILVLIAICQIVLDKHQDMIGTLEKSLDLIETIGWCNDEDDYLIVYKLVSHMLLAPLYFVRFNLAKSLYHHKQVMAIRTKLGYVRWGIIKENAFRILELRKKK